MQEDYSNFTVDPSLTVERLGTKGVKFITFLIESWSFCSNQCCRYSILLHQLDVILSRKKNSWSKAICSLLPLSSWASGVNFCYSVHLRSGIPKGPGITSFTIMFTDVQYSEVCNVWRSLGLLVYSFDNRMQYANLHLSKLIQMEWLDFLISILFCFFQTSLFSNQPKKSSFLDFWFV